MDNTGNGKQIWAWIIIAVIVIGAGWWLMGNKAPTETGPIKIGAVLALTGDLAMYAEGAKNAINLAINDSGFKDRVNLTIEDDHGCLPADAVSAAQKLVNIDKVKAIIGSMCTGSTMAIAPIAEQNKVIVMVPTATGKSVTDAGQYVFRTIASDADKSIAVAKYAYNNKGFRKAALLSDSAQDAFVSQRDDVKKAFVNLSGQIVIDESYVSSNKDLRSQLTAIKNSNPDVIFVAAMPETLGLILKQARTLGIRTTFISTDTTGGTQPVIDIAGPSAEGLIFPFATTPDNKEYTDFIASYKTKYEAEPSAYAAESYDATMILIKAMVASDGTADSIKDQLFKIGNNYAGASGVITFDQNGDVQKPMVIKVIKDGVAVQVNQ